MVNRFVPFAAVAAFLFAATAAQALDPALTCETGKLKEAGKYANCRLKAESTAVKKGIPPDYTKCDSKIADKWGKIETKGAGQCPSSTDLTDIEAHSTRYADRVASCLSGTCASECTGDDKTVCYVMLGYLFADPAPPTGCVACLSSQPNGCVEAAWPLYCGDPGANSVCNDDARTLCAAECCP